MANVLYPVAKKAFLDGGINLLSDTINVLLIKNTGGRAYTAGDTTVATVITGSAEVSGTNYARKTLGTKDTTGGVFDAADIAWTAINAGDARAAVIFKSTGSDATSVPIAWIDTVTGATFPVTFNGGDYSLNWDNGANKIFAL